jgi:hypothetical protein
MKKLFVVFLVFLALVSISAIALAEQSGSEARIKSNDNMAVPLNSSVWTWSAPNKELLELAAKGEECKSKGEACRSDRECCSSNCVKPSPREGGTCQ